MSVVIRKNAETMPEDEWNRFVDSLNAYKASGRYDQTTQNHARAMRTLTPWPGDTTATQRNVAHRGPAFLPWHREAIRELELDLIDIQSDLFPGDAPVAVPYWAWNRNTNAWRSAAIWRRVGGNGNPRNNNLVTDGPFAGWTSTIISGSGFRSRQGIMRRFRTNAMPNWGGTTIRNFDVSPWNERSSSSTSFRLFMEVRHNQVHTNVGGDMLAPTSPNDPIFWLHHCNVDRAWARWQNARGLTNYQPNGEGPMGHNSNDVPIFLDSADFNPPKIISEMLDRVNFEGPGDGFTYDTLNP